MRILWLAGPIIVLASCAAPPQGPIKPDKPECLTPEKAPIDGGLGGTGKSEDDPCARQKS